MGTDLGSSFWGMVLIVASTNNLTLRIAAALLCVALVIVLVVAKNVSSSIRSLSLNSIRQFWKVCFWYELSATLTKAPIEWWHHGMLKISYLCQEMHQRI